jgi:hypothetical protein
MLQFFGKRKQACTDKEGDSSDSDSSSSDASEEENNKENTRPPGSPAFGDSDEEDFDQPHKGKDKSKAGKDKGAKCRPTATRSAKGGSKTSRTAKKSRR